VEEKIVITLASGKLSVAATPMDRVKAAGILALASVQMAVSEPDVVLKAASETVREEVSEGG
jgi:hypothetical protein